MGRVNWPMSRTSWSEPTSHLSRLSDRRQVGITVGRGGKIVLLTLTMLLTWNPQVKNGRILVVQRGFWSSLSDAGET